MKVPSGACENGATILLLANGAKSVIIASNMAPLKYGSVLKAITCMILIFHSTLWPNLIF